MSQFDPNVFLDATTTEVNEKRPLIPEENPSSTDGFYDAQIGEITFEGGTIEKGDNAGKPWVSAVIPLRLQLPAELQAMGLPDSFQLTDRAFLDLKEDGRTMDMGKGKNRAQRNYREATGQNVAGEPWAWRMLTGKMVKVQIKHDMYKETVQEKVKNVFPS